FCWPVQPGSSGAIMPLAPMSTGCGTGQSRSLGGQLSYGLGISGSVVPQKFDVVAELYGLMGPNSFKIVGGAVTNDKLGPAAEAIGGIKLYLARNSFFEAGGGWRVADGYGGGQPRAFIGFIFEPNIGDRDGDGYKDDVDGCPDDPEDFDDFEDADGCPDPDNDKDGIPDKNDLCPNDPEDKDGFEDQDGCPDPDNDHDRILDKDDKCPNEPETYNGYQDADGCPDKGKVIVHKGKLEILDKIYFETDKDEIKPISFPLLDAIAATINGNPQIELIEIQGHADERGDDAHNLDLTERRAHSVRVALEQRNVLPSRLKSHGYGETKPICMQHNEDCWSQNRRVEFIILKRSDEAKLQGGEGQ
ncbi:MAG TPA: OmpA family protein, partial [Candidatus Binatus sp.]|nr:OmpA family protein [Candidatus Binatus sp.]